MLILWSNAVGPTHVTRLRVPAMPPAVIMVVRTCAAGTAAVVYPALSPWYVEVWPLGEHPEVCAALQTGRSAAQGPLLMFFFRRASQKSVLLEKAIRR